MRIIGQIICLLMLCALSACTSMEREILYQEYDGLSRAELHRKGKEGKWAVYNGLARKYDSDFIYDSYEALNLAEIDGRERYYSQLKAHCTRLNSNSILEAVKNFSTECKLILHSVVF